MLNLTKPNNYISNSNQNNRSGLKQNNNVSTYSDNFNLQIYNIIKDICRKKNGKVTKEDIISNGIQKLKDKKKVEDCIKFLLAEGYILEEDDNFSVMANFFG